MYWDKWKKIQTWGGQLIISGCLSHTHPKRLLCTFFKWKKKYTITCRYSSKWHNNKHFTMHSFQEGEYEWSGQTQAILLGAFFYGYTVTNFLGGRTAEYLGGRLIFGLGVVVPSILSLLSPLCVHTSSALFIALRILEGMTQVRMLLVPCYFIDC